MVVLVRHGRTEFNNKKGRDAELFRGNLDIPLNNEGQAEAKAAARSVSLPIRFVVSDSIPRDYQTAAIIAESKGAPHLVDPRLAPLDIGMLSGKSVRDVGATVDWFFQNPDVPLPDGESVGDWYTRQKAAILDYLEMDQGDKHSAIVLVVQGSTFRALPAMRSGDDWSLIEPTTERIRTGRIEWLN